jgi:hypothetical protein
MPAMKKDTKKLSELLDVCANHETKLDTICTRILDTNMRKEDASKLVLDWDAERTRLRIEAGKEFYRLTKEYNNPNCAGIVGVKFMREAVVFLQEQDMPE